MMNIGLLITARLKSIRLKRKALIPILNRPLIGHAVDRLRMAVPRERIVVCTSYLREDDPLESFALEEGLQSFRGDPDDVLKRLFDASREFHFDVTVNVTADNVFFDPHVLRRLLNFHEYGRYDYTATEGLPLGTEYRIVERSALEEALAIKESVETEVWPPIFLNEERFRCGVLSIKDPNLRWPGLRLTVDTPLDLSFMKEVFDRLYVPGTIFSLSQVVRLCREYPEIPRINSGVKQKAPEIWRTYNS